jgi:hypothetical protein
VKTPDFIMTIYEIKNRTLESSPYFFTRDTLKFFGQTMRSFSVKKQADGRYKIAAPIIDHRGERRGQTVRFFNPETNTLDHN